MRTAILLLISCWGLSLSAQLHSMSEDSLYGSLNPYRTSFDMTAYELSLSIDPARQSIAGKNKISFRALKAMDTMQLELTDNYNIKRVEWNEKVVDFERRGRIFYLYLPQKLEAGSQHSVVVHYQGQPQVAANPPWDGGFVWTRDSSDNPLVGVACEGEGASIWWPCKDHLSDEPNRVTMHYTVPDSLVAVGNGRIIDTTATDTGWTTYTWQVVNPINLYNVTLYVGDYGHFDDSYAGLNGQLDLDYYVLPENLKKARKQFEDVPKTLEAFEHFFGPYPFYEDGFKLVETNYLGMEHQSAIAYGNQYKKGYLGYDPSGLGFDYIIVHEAGHEWFGNSVSAEVLAEIWIHESFTTYSEALYVEYHSSLDNAKDYLMNQRLNITNRRPIVRSKEGGHTGEFAGTDKYYKGSWMLHSMRYLLNDEEAWFALLRAFSKDFYHTVTNTEEVIRYFEANTETEVEPLMRQFLYHATPPTLLIREKDGEVAVRWKVDVKSFTMPVEYEVKKDQYEKMALGTEWMIIPGLDKLSIFDINRRNAYFAVEKVDE